jgi:S-formylglutathione hydrolase
MKPLKSHRTFEGLTEFWEHDSQETKTKMRFSTYRPPGEIKGAVIFLAGLTCTEENFIVKAGAQSHLKDLGLMVICPDTSPRGLNLPGEHDSYDFGSGAGFYVDAQTPGYRDHYRMYSYVTRELYDLLPAFFKIPTDRISIAGHSMGGHGALVIALREPKKFKSVSAFAPISHPTQCAWGEKAFTGYLGADRAAWNAYDATELIRSGKRFAGTLLIDQGQSDEFLEKQLRPSDLEAACAEKDQPIRLRYREGYDHSYYFIQTFIGEHLKFHAAIFDKPQKLQLD